MPGGIGDAETYKVGTLIIVLFDAKTSKLPPKGSTGDRLFQNSDKDIENLDKAVHKMFKNFLEAHSRK